jgi:HdeA/HdeB family
MPVAVRRSAPLSVELAAPHAGAPRAVPGLAFDDGEPLADGMSPNTKGMRMQKALSAVLLALCLAACAAQPTPPAAPPVSSVPPPAATAAAPASPPSEAQVGPGRWNVERVRCSDLLGASDEDRAAAAMFYYGYLAAKAGIRVIDVNRIEANIAKVMQRCVAAPNLTVPQAFRQALRAPPAHG